MSETIFDLSNVITVSLLSTQAGLADVNTSVVGLITDEAPIPGDYGDYGIYKGINGVANDWGSNSETYALAEKVFGQSPNVKTGKGYLVIIPRNQSAEAQPATIIGSARVNLTALTAGDYNMTVSIDGAGEQNITIGEIDSSSIEDAEASLNNAAVTAAGLAFSLSGQDVANVLVTLSTVSTGAASAINIGEVASGTDIASVLGLSGDASGAAAGVERVKDCIIRTQGAIPYFGIILNEKQSDTTLLELASYIQCLDKLLVVGSNLTDDIAGIFKDVCDSGYTHTRCLCYTESESDALAFAAAYASNGLSVNYDGVKTQRTMHLKSLVGLTADTGLTQTLLDSCGKYGVDVYIDFGVIRVFTSGANLYFDQIYSRLALKLRLQTAGFNALATTSTKIPQTEEGMNNLKSAYRKILQKFVSNGTYAPGTWNSADTYGDPEDHIRNIEENGYYIYSSPLSEQSQSEREARVAPLVQIAAKESGAIHSSDVTVLVEP